jgi:hypothetical protein
VAASFWAGARACVSAIEPPTPNIAGLRMPDDGMVFCDGGHVSLFMQT